MVKRGERENKLEKKRQMILNYNKKSRKYLGYKREAQGNNMNKTRRLIRFRKMGG